MGYLNVKGEYVEGEGLIQEFFNRPAIFDNDADFAETVAGSPTTPLIYGLEASEIMQAVWKALQEKENWTSMAQGFASYPIDIGWFGYGVAAWTGALGGDNERKVKATGEKVGELIEEAASFLLPAAAGTAVGVAASVPQNMNKLAFLGSVYLNYLLTGGAFKAGGRFVGGMATKYFVALLISRGAMSVGIPISPDSIRNNKWYSRGFLGVTTAGSMVRTGEKMHDKFGSVADLTLMDVIVSATTGEDDAEAIKGVVRQLGMDISGRLENLYDDIPIEYERYGTASYKEMQELRWELFQAMSSVRYTYDENAFYEQLIKAHNTCIRLRDQGVKHPTIDYFIKLADPTLLHIIRLMFFSLMATFDNMLVIPKSANLYWDLLQAELAKGSEINNTGNILP
jgi:hypothetical protein